jgi:SpoVK/Ycf46/Vps4 family AAA+-type ATPase
LGASVLISARWYEFLDFGSVSTSLAGRLIPVARIADDLLRATFVEGGCGHVFEDRPGIFVVHGVRPADGSTVHQAALELIGGTMEASFPLNATVRDWTDPPRLRSNFVEHVLLEASTSTRPTIIFCHTRKKVPAVVASVADAIVRLADSRKVIADFAEKIDGAPLDDAMVCRLARLPLAYLNLVLRPGMTRERMWTVAGRLRRHAADAEIGGTKNASGHKDGKPAAGLLTQEPQDKGHPERLEDLSGMDEARSWGLSLAADLAEHAAGTLPWCDIESGVLLHGPPGTGKTMFAQALAGSCGVRLQVHSVAAWQAKGHLGDMLKAMRGAFDEARKSGPSILFIDELDSVGSRDEPLGDHASYQRQVVNGLLECLDGAVDRGGVVVVGATNNVGAIDRAVLRPGRLGRLVEVRLPDLAGRIGILRHHLRGDLLDADLAGIADEIGEASGATLAQIVRETRSAARRERRAIAEADLWRAVPSGVLLSAKAFRRLCVHEAGHVTVGHELAPMSGLVPTRATVRRRMRHGNEHQTEFSVVEGFDQTLASVEAHIAVLLAGLAAEEVLLGSRGSGSGGTAEADLVRATQLAATAERSLGLGGRLFSVPSGQTMASDASAGDDPGLRQRVEHVLARCLREAKLVIERKRDDVEAVAERLAEMGVVILG